MAALGVRDVLGLPLRALVDEQRGVFLLYADTENCFNRVGLGLLKALAELLNRHALPALSHALDNGPVLTVSASIGVCELAPGELLQPAIGRADIAMYRAKRAGRDRVMLG